MKQRQERMCEEVGSEWIGIMAILIWQILSRSLLAEYHDFLLIGAQ